MVKTGVSLILSVLVGIMIFGLIGIVSATTDCAEAGEFCGGIAGILCCGNATCEYTGTYPDAGGTCVTNYSSEDVMGCKNFYWFDDTNRSCEQKEFCGAHMYLGLQTFESKAQCLKALNETNCPIYTSPLCEKGEQIGSGKDKNGCPMPVCESKNESEGCACTMDAKECDDGSYVGRVCPNCEFAPCNGKGNEIKNKENETKYFSLSNGRKAEIKIMPSTASETAIARLGELNFTIELKEVGQNKTAYELTAEKQGRFLGIIKTTGKLKIQVDAETGEIISVKKPWWAFLATRI